ncbi:MULTISPECIES: hypothetical protein [Halorussus]|uniref:hypothetical protein n=1 Tax=Halorussus TaxID=1070314 RepID=UPI00209DDDDA|nr:hypothetical protein [Halorussus vallis]USZ76159.1 hypothetical protein NGM07_02260 [Halorussus vallis]
MIPASDLVSFVFILETTALVIASLLLVYPVVTHARNVAHTRGLLLLAAAFLLVTASYVAAVPLHRPLVSEALEFVASLFAAAGIWQFARPFVRFGDEEFDASAVGETAGGFESAGDD